MSQKTPSLPDQIRDAIAQDSRTLYRLSLDSGVSQAVLSRFVRSERDLNLRTADKISQPLGLALQPAKKKG